MRSVSQILTDALLSTTVYFSAVTGVRLKKGMCPSRKMTLGVPARPHVLIWTDACNDNEYSGLGLVSVCIDATTPQRTMSADVCLPWLLATFKAQCSLVICVLKMHAGLCGLLTLGHELRGRRAYFFCDNTAAWSSMITGYSSSKTMARVSALFHLFVADHDIDLWVEWVNTDTIIADLPSRPLTLKDNPPPCQPLHDFHL